MTERKFFRLRNPEGEAMREVLAVEQYDRLITSVHQAAYDERAMN